MFTGIVEELGLLHRFENRGSYASLQVQASKVLQDLQTGDSIAVNGVCQTVETLEPGSFTVASFAETLAKTNLGQLRKGAELHLERSLTLNTRLGGHIVQGHVDGIGRLREIRRVNENYYLCVYLPSELMDICVLHGSICLDGVSLTISRLHEDSIEVNIVAHTWKHTLFHSYKIGRAINVECDILGKYILRLVQRGLFRGIAQHRPTPQSFQTEGQPESKQCLTDLLKDW